MRVRGGDTDVESVKAVSDRSGENVGRAEGSAGDQVRGFELGAGVGFIWSSGIQKARS